MDIEKLRTLYLKGAAVENPERVLGASLSLIKQELRQQFPDSYNDSAVLRLARNPEFVADTRKPHWLTYEYHCSEKTIRDARRLADRAKYYPELLDPPSR